MQMHTFLERTAELAHLASREAAEPLVAATLSTLAERLPHEEAKNLAAQLPEELKVHLADAPDMHHIDKMHTGAFFARIAERLGTDIDGGRSAARAVAQVLQEAISAGQLRHVRQMMPGDLKGLFDPQSELN